MTRMTSPFNETCSSRFPEFVNGLPVVVNIGVLRNTSLYVHQALICIYQCQWLLVDNIHDGHYCRLMSSFTKGFVIWVFTTNKKNLPFGLRDVHP